MTIAAIETTYAGHRFRSRLEARWAVFFDALGVRWLYEAQGYETAVGRYLPDFWLPDAACWVEVKGRLTKEEWDRLAAVIWDLPAKPVDLPVGPISVLTPSLLLLGEIPSVADGLLAAHVLFEWGIGPDKTPATGWRSAAFRSGYVLPIGHQYRTSTVQSPSVLLESRRFMDLVPDDGVASAYERARRARFEFGESG